MKLKAAYYTIFHWACSTIERDEYETRGENMVGFAFEQQ